MIRIKKSQIYQNLIVLRQDWPCWYADEVISNNVDLYSFVSLLHKSIILKLFTLSRDNFFYWNVLSFCQIFKPESKKKIQKNLHYSCSSSKLWFLLSKVTFKSPLIQINPQIKILTAWVFQSLQSPFNVFQEISLILGGKPRLCVVWLTIHFPTNLASSIDSHARRSLVKCQTHRLSLPIPPTLSLPRSPAGVIMMDVI